MNHKTMENINSSIRVLFDSYLVEKEGRKAKSNLVSYQQVVNDIPSLFEKNAHLPNNIIVKGSIGQGVVTEIPWVCFFDSEITKSAQNGYYICILFCADMSGFYLSLNQGWEQYHKKFGAREGKLEIRVNSDKATKLLKSVRGFHRGELDLKATLSLGKGYEAGNIFYQYYSAENLPDDKTLISDLHQLLGAYRELKGLVGLEILSIRSTGSEEAFQEEVQNIEQAELNVGPIEKPKHSTRINSTVWRRNPAVAKKALIKANFTCEIDDSHKTFHSKASGKPYVEVHHLVPMEQQDEFDISLDVPENIIALCPNCHRKIHLSAKGEVEPMLEKLLTLRKLGLESREIMIEIAQLKKIYQVVEFQEF